MARLTREFDFDGAQGHRLAGRLDLPATPPIATALFAHCFTCSKDFHASARISRALAEQGFAVLRFDFTGLGNSGGDFANTNFSSNVADLVAAAEALGREIAPPRLLIGHSLGGAAVVRAATRIPSVQAIATLCSPYSPHHLAWIVQGKEAEIAERGETSATIAGRSFTITRQFLDDIQANRMEDSLARTGKAILVLHDPADTVVGIENAEKMMTAACWPKAFVSLDGAGHMVGKASDAAFAADTIGRWAKRQLKLDTDAAAVPTGPKDAVIVEETGTGRLVNRVLAGGHQLFADEPTEVGGTDVGPNPYKLLLSALGACTSMTVRLYAERKGWPLEKIKVTLTHDKVPAPEGVQTENAGNKVDRIERRVSFQGPLDAEQRARLLEISEKCPVHRTLLSTPEIATVLAEGEG